MLTSIDYFIVIAYILGILMLGYYFKRFVATSEDYFLGGKSLPFWAIGMSIVVSDIGALDFVGVSGQAYRYGVSVGNFDWIGSVPALLLAAFVFIPYFWRGGMYTIPEYLGRRYNSTVRTLASLTWIIFFALDLGILFWASAVLLNVLMGWPIWISILVTASVVGLYTYFGGITAVVMTDVVQLIIMFIGGFALVFLGLHAVGGWDALVTKVTAMGPEYEKHFELIQSTNTNTPFPWTGILFGLTFVMSTAYFIGNQSIVQRTLTAKNEWHAKASMIFAAGLKMLIPVLVLFPGLMAIVLHPGLEDGDKALPMMIKSVLPPGLIGLMFSAFFAGLMSSVDSLLNSTATLFTKDIYEPYINNDADDKHYLKVGKITTLVLLLLGVLTSPVSSYFPGIYVAIQSILSYFQGPLFAILLVGIFWRRTTAMGGLAGMVIGMAFAAYLNIFSEQYFTIEDPFLYISWWSFVLGFVITVGVSLFTKPHDSDRLKGLIYSLKEDKD
ncbi:MAG: sodium/solute symporter [Bacteroidota bacterium]